MSFNNGEYKLNLTSTPNFRTKFLMTKEVETPLLLTEMSSPEKELKELFEVFDQVSMIRTDPGGIMVGEPLLKRFVKREVGSKSCFKD